MGLTHRIRYDEGRNTLFLNLGQLEVRSLETIAAIADQVCRICEPLGQPVHAVICYDGFAIDRQLEEPYARMVRELTARFCLGVTSFTAGRFIRARPGGEALALRP